MWGTQHFTMIKKLNFTHDSQGSIQKHTLIVIIATSIKSIDINAFYDQRGSVLYIYILSSKLGAHYIYAGKGVPHGPLGAQNPPRGPMIKKKITSF